MEMTSLDLFREMSVTAMAVMLALLAMSMLMVALAVSKWRRLRKMAAQTRAYSQRFGALLEQGQVNHAIALSSDFPESHLARVLGAGLRGSTSMLRKGRIDRAAEVAERAMEREQILLATNLRVGLGTIATIGATAPFLGLLGTVIGITSSFTGMAAAGGGGIEAVAGGIGEALLTTEAGLIVAIPALWIYNHFVTRLERLFSEVAYAGQELVEWIELQEESSSETTASEGDSKDSADQDKRKATPESDVIETALLL